MPPSRVALGCVTFGREIVEEASFRILDHAFEKGVRLLDTAAVYGAGASERVIGKWLRRSGVRNAVRLQTKVSSDFTVAGVCKSLEGSFERLGTDYLDLCLLHRLDESMATAECVAAMSECGVRATGCSNASYECLRDAMAELRRAGLASFRMIQPPYNLLQRSIEREILPFCSANDIEVVTYSPLAAGFLSGKYTPDVSALPAGTRFAMIPGHVGVYFSERNFEIVRRLHHFAASVGIPPLRLAFGWVFRNHSVDGVLAGARDPAHIDNAFDAERMEIPDAWMREMDLWADVLT